MRLGGPVFTPYNQQPEAWFAEHKASGYRACYCPLDLAAGEAESQAFRQAAEQAGIVIAEVGAWSNPLGPDETERKKAVEHCVQALALAERVGARCCVNISGSRGTPWDGPHPANLTPETFELVVVTTRQIIDAVQPHRTFFTLETMPWMFPDSVDSYLELIHAIDRRAFGAHLDPVNLICSPQRFFATGVLIKDAIHRLGPYLRSCHAKDILLHSQLTVHLDEVIPGQGGLDYPTYLRELARLEPDMPLMLEHLPTVAQYAQAATHIRSIAAQADVPLN